jgi:hypothetical protein
MAIFQLPTLREEGKSGVVLEAVRQHNQKIREDSADLAEIMQEYPYQFEILPYQEDMEALQARGFRFLLYQLYDSGESIKKYLNYQMNPSETDYISVTLAGEKPRLKTISVDRPVFKYYVKHIYSQDVFLGKDWDSDPDWRTALRNQIEGLKRATNAK